MIFAPKPENDFAFFIRTYYEACRRRFDKIEAIAGKWMFRDLLPGMSDFDARFIVADDMTCDDWCRMSAAVGEAHHALCGKYPVWARILEHLPGVNVTWHELTAEETYYPEYLQWTFYHSSAPERLHQAERTLSDRGLDLKDEYFHLGRFCTYFGRYNRTIDRPINMGVHANKYPLHSRLMHYFAPPVHSAMFLLNRRAYVGKFDALEAACRLFPALRCWDYLWEILGRSYETPRWYDEDALEELEDSLEEGLNVIAAALRDVVTLIPPEIGIDISGWKRSLADIRIDPGMEFFHQVKFSRLMKGRLLFYGNAPEHFETDWLIRNELGRIGANFFTTPFRLLWRVIDGRDVESPIAVIDELQGDLLASDEIQAVKAFHRLTSVPAAAGEEKKAAVQIAGIFDDYYAVLWKIGRVVATARPAAPGAV